MSEVSTLRSSKLDFAEEPAAKSLQPSLPLVSVIITNYNYAAYLNQAVTSVLEQTYPNIECIIVDDCSTDNSRAVIDEITAKHPTVAFYQNERNSGQSVGCVNGLRRAKGQFIIFLDADDYLLARCVETHILTHLSLRAPIGFTSVEMFQLVNEGIVTTASQGFDDYVRLKRPRERGFFKDIAGERLGLQRDDTLKSKVHYVRPRDCGMFPWSPTSANCFRRDALELVMFNPRLTTLRTSTDTYMLRGVSALCGSALIDEPLAAYRIHTGNNFISRATLHQVRPFNATRFAPVSQTAMVLIIDHILDELPKLNELMESRKLLVDALVGLSRTWPWVHAEHSKLNYLTDRLLVESERFKKLFGMELYLRALLPSQKLIPAFLMLPLINLAAFVMRSRRRRQLQAIGREVGTAERSFDRPS